MLRFHHLRWNCQFAQSVQSLYFGSRNNGTQSVKSFSSLATAHNLDGKPFFKTSETNPVNLSDIHLGRYYTISDEVYKKIYIPYQGFPTEFREQCETFREQCVLVRKPFLDLKRCVEALDLQKPIVRFVIYGEEGVGKAMTLANMVHYGYAKEFILLNFPWVPLFTRWHKEVVPSTFRPGFYDHTIDAVTWLLHFKAQNTDLIQKLNLVTGREYQWSKRETTPAGTSLSEIVEHGIARPAHATECIVVLFKELKEQSSQQKCKTMVLAGGLNDIFYDCEWFCKEKEPTRRMRRRWKKTHIPVSNVTLYSVFKDIFKTDWSGGVAICTADKMALNLPYRDSDLPRYLLRKEGWELFDPFVPIEVPKYTSQEIQTTIDYYLERNWLTHPGSRTVEGRLELEILSTRNPLTLLTLARSR